MPQSAVQVEWLICGVVDIVPVFVQELCWEILSAQIYNLSCYKEQMTFCENMITNCQSLGISFKTISYSRYS